MSRSFGIRLASALAAGMLLLNQQGMSQDDSGLGAVQIPEQRLPLCFGFRDIRNPRALEVCDALNLNENVRARELSEQWVREEPDNPAAQFALAEVLLTIEGNMPRALFHLNRAEELTDYGSFEEALDSGNIQWHYLTLSQLSYVHQLMGEQLLSLEYLDKIKQIYDQDIESFRGWPLIKLKQYEEARASANRVLENSDDRMARARAWNTLCAVELASLAPVESMGACERSISEDDAIAAQTGAVDTVYLTNASEVALSLLRMDEAEQYLDRATRYLNPDSVADPWVYKLYLLMSQARHDEARQALDRMLVWRDQQEPIVNVMNRAEHFMVSADFLLLAGYIEDAVKLSGTALNQPDRNGSYSADDAQKDSYAALVHHIALRSAYELAMERAASQPLPARLTAQLKAQNLRLQAWRSGRRAAALFADTEVLQSRLRPYSPLDVHIPEWIEPHIVELVGTGVVANTLNQARENGAFQLNDGYFYAYSSEIAALEGEHEQVLAYGEQALALLPDVEALMQARVSARMARAAWETGNQALALRLYEQVLQQDPGLLRRLGDALPVQISATDNSLTESIADALERSPRFQLASAGLPLRIRDDGNPVACLDNQAGSPLACYTFDTSDLSIMSDSESAGSRDPDAIVAAFSQAFHSELFGLGFDISQAQRSRLLGSSVILSSQTNANMRNSQEAFLGR